MIGLPGGCLQSCRCIQKVACFPCAESHKEFRQHSEKPCANTGVAGLLTVATFPGQATLSCLESCQPKGGAR